MTILLLLVSLAGIGLYFLQPTASYRLIAGGVGIVASIALLLVRLMSGGPESIDYLDRFEEAIGHQMALELKERVPASGKVIVLPLTPENEAEKKRHDILLSAFLKELEGSDWTPIISENENLPKQMAPFGASPNVFGEEMRNHSDARAIVSFIGLPIMDPAQWPNMPLLAQEFRPDRRIRSWKSQPAAKAVITLQEEFDRSARPKGKDLETVFAIRYQVQAP